MGLGWDYSPARSSEELMKGMGSGPGTACNRKKGAEPGLGGRLEGRVTGKQLLPAV